jgi:hypothetical protein
LETTDIINIVSDTANSIDAAITIMEITWWHLLKSLEMFLKII